MASLRIADADIIFLPWFLLLSSIFMVALCNRADHYIFMLWFVVLLLLLLLSFVFFLA